MIFGVEKGLGLMPWSRGQPTLQRYNDHQTTSIFSDHFDCGEGKLRISVSPYEIS